MGDDEVCITQVQYNDLMSLTKEARDKSVSVETSLCEDVLPALEQLDESIRGNGKTGLQTRVAVLETVNNIENEYTRELSQAKRDIISQQVDHVKARSVDWKWVAVLAVGIVQAIGLYLVVSS